MGKEETVTQSNNKEESSTHSESSSPSSSPSPSCRQRSNTTDNNNQTPTNSSPQACEAEERMIIRENKIHSESCNKWKGDKMSGDGLMVALSKVCSNTQK